MLYFIAAHNWLFFSFLGIIGLAAGSFLNTVIHRLPRMLEREWQQECNNFLKHHEQSSIKSERYNLATPSSHCPVCRSTLKAWHNIPVLSYFLLSGRCSNCKTKIPFRYFVVELLCLGMFIICGLEFGLSLNLFAAIIYTCFLVAASFIDLEQGILPDKLTMPLLWLGLFFSCFDLFTNSHDAIIGAIFGYLLFLIIEYAFKFITGKEGIGQGDFKLLAAIGAWLGWQNLLFVLLGGSISGLVVGILMVLFKRTNRNTPIPFGPFLAIFAWIAIMWGFEVTQYIFQLCHLNLVEI